MRRGHDRNYGKWFASDVLRAIGRYRMIEPGQRVCAAISGGRDSAVLLWVLDHLNRHSHLHFELSAIHVRVAEYDTAPLRALCAALSVPYRETALERPVPAGPRKGVCSACARARRGAMAVALAREGIGTVAYGHHAGDVAETFFLNLVEGGRLGSFCPVVEVPGAPLRIVRPLIYLEARTVERLHRHAALPRLDWRCPHADDGARASMRARLAGIADALGVPGLARRVVDALENVDDANRWTPTPLEGAGRT